jgi:hypothetical protein
VTRPLILRPAAEEDVAAAYHWYEERSPGLGSEFLPYAEAGLASEERNGISINQFVGTPVAEKMSALMTEEYLQERTRRASRERYEAALAEAPDVEPDEYDLL